MAGHLTATVSREAVAANLRALRGVLPRATELCAVVKADGYGHGLRLLLPTLASGADRLAVSTPEEALELRSLGYSGPVLVFFSVFAYADAGDGEALRDLVAAGVELTVASSPEAAVVAAAARGTRRRAVVHLKVDTGMGRSGVLFGEAGALISRLRTARDLRLAGVYTQFACADEPELGMTEHQLERLLAAVEEGGGRAGLCLHAANSAALVETPDAHLDMVRPGLAVYGYRPSASRRVALEPCMDLRSRVMQVKTVPRGSGTGYGQIRVLQRDTRLGIVPVGYADGYLRCLGDVARMRIRGSLVPVCGRVSMDLVVLDVTDVPGVVAGDVVEVVSRTPEDPHSVESLARLAETIPYEITCRLGPRVHRVRAP